MASPWRGPVPLLEDRNSPRWGPVPLGGDRYEYKDTKHKTRIQRYKTQAKYDVKL